MTTASSASTGGPDRGQATRRLLQQVPAFFAPPTLAGLVRHTLGVQADATPGVNFSTVNNPQSVVNV